MLCVRILRRDPATVALPVPPFGRRRAAVNQPRSKDEAGRGWLQECVSGRLSIMLGRSEASFGDPSPYASAQGPDDMVIESTPITGHDQSTSTMRNPDAHLTTGIASRPER